MHPPPSQGAFYLCLLILISCKKDTGGSNPGPGSTKPNIILILGDDVGYEIPNYTGGQSYSTPSINALAASGIQFSRCHVCPNCSPTRVELLTGKYGFRNYSGWGSLDPSQKTFANMLHDAGYRTCAAGKWQLGEAMLPYMASDLTGTVYLSLLMWLMRAKQTCVAIKIPAFTKNGAYLPESYTNGKYADDLLTDYIFNFIDSNLSSPFFVYFSLSLCHKPFSPTPDDPRFPHGIRYQINPMLPSIHRWLSIWIKK
jgi:arylsulfatase A